MATHYDPSYEQKNAGAEVYAAHSNNESPERNVQPNSVVVDINHTGKTFWQRIWPAMACGSGLFSDGYLNGVRDPLQSSLMYAHVY